MSKNIAYTKLAKHFHHYPPLSTMVEHTFLKVKGTSIHVTYARVFLHL